MAITPSVRLSVSEAAKLFGVSTRTIRRSIAKNDISYIVVQGRYKIDFESLLKWSQSSTTVRKKRDSAGIGQFVERWRIKNTLYSPNPQRIPTDEKEDKGDLKDL
ncbi:helix-turn-helix domain-containing protein [Candidatus Uhrbacteria bacterium]|jgi:excisionase family DNA binding protein|nr:helix-turn-helix domain-containing protein [Candidatus Uhrbacteria bacterium]